MRQVTRRALARLATGAGVAAGAGRALAAAAGAQAAFDPTPYVNPELRRFVPMIRKATSAPLTAETLAAARRRSLGRPPSAAPVWSERIIAGPRGGPDVRIYVINARAGGAPRPAILHTHGGGFVLGDAKSSIADLQEVAAALDCVIVTVDYRLAPETRFPGSLEDNYAGLKWLHAHAAELGADPARIAVMGESAGGGHAAMLAIAARDRGEVPLIYQALVYPMLDDRTGSTRQRPPWQGALIWTPAQNRFGWSSLLGVPAGSPRAPEGAVPGRVANLRGLPPTFIGVGSIDLFVDEDIDYARRLIDAGIPVTLDVVPGGFHGFPFIPGSALGKRFKADLVEALRAGLQGRG